MPVDDQARRFAVAAQHANDRGYEVTAVAPGMVALRMVLDGQADVVIAAQALDLPEVEIADRPPPVVPRQPASPAVVPPSRRRPRLASRRCDT
ncbi:hypothetical protein ACTWLT_09580 [Micromonospora sp. ZYX-F-536]|uniref:hypothetical protein n=1 Tax=Micromonospora sp. ZYX-F-536 TaxID=3457629 RepID=UPI004040AFF2